MDAFNISAFALDTSVMYISYNVIGKCVKCYLNILHACCLYYVFFPLFLKKHLINKPQWKYVVANLLATIKYTIKYVCTYAVLICYNTATKDLRHTAPEESAYNYNLSNPKQGNHKGEIT